VTYTWKVKLDAPFKLNCQFLLDDTSPLARIPSVPSAVLERYRALNGAIYNG